METKTHLPAGSKGFILVFTILLTLGVTAIAVGTIYNNHMNELNALNYKNRLQTFTATDGVMTLLAQEILNGRAGVYIDSTRFGTIHGKVWNTGLTAIPAFKTLGAGSNADSISDYLGSNWGWKGNYGVKWTGYLLPPATGSYTFYLYSDDASSFYLSTDSTAGNLSTAPVCSLSSWVGSWQTSGSGVSVPKVLTTGKSYYFEYDHLQQSGPGYGQVGWSGPNWLSELPIPGERLSQYSSNVFNGRSMVDSISVRYGIMPISYGQYNLTTEADKTKAGSASDTAFRAPLNQFISIQGALTAPPDTQWVRAIFYDYHGNHSNPEFENVNCCYSSGGMVQANTLTYDPTNADYFGLTTLAKPVRGPNPRLSCNVDKWFVPWQVPINDSIQSYLTAPYSDCSTKKLYNADGNRINDTAFKNTVVKDLLPFVRTPSLGPNVYVFDRSLSANEFFWLDGKGFDCCGNSDKQYNWGNDSWHNYSFCMEIHSQFEHTSGRIFQFIGDDDIWVFVNSNLVIDLGGVHGSDTGYVNLDTLNLKYGHNYPLDIFECERHTIDSHVKIVTNLPLAKPITKPTTSWKRDYGSLN